MPTAILADDEPILRDQLAGKLARLWPELELLACVGDGAAALEALSRRAPDFLFLDIRMPEASGVEVALAAAGRCHIVFVTAYDEYAIQAFETGAVDDVHKPATDERLAKTIARGCERRPEGARVLLHSWPDVTLHALPLVFERLSERGARYVCVDELLSTSADG